MHDRLPMSDLQKLLYVIQVMLAMVISSRKLM